MDGREAGAPLLFLFRLGGDGGWLLPSCKKFEFSIQYPMLRVDVMNAKQTTPAAELHIQLESDKILPVRSHSCDGADCSSPAIILKVDLKGICNNNNNSNSRWAHYMSTDQI